jgi:hypothetical protein
VVCACSSAAPNLPALLCGGGGGGVAPHGITGWAEGANWGLTGRWGMAGNGARPNSAGGAHRASLHAKEDGEQRKQVARKAVREGPS